LIIIFLSFGASPWPCPHAINKGAFLYIFTTWMKWKIFSKIVVRAWVVSLLFSFDSYIEKFSQVVDLPSIILEGFKSWRCHVHLIFYLNMFSFHVVSDFLYLFLPLFHNCRMLFSSMAPYVTPILVLSWRMKTTTPLGLV